MERTLKKIEPLDSSIDEFICGLTTFSEKYPSLQIFLHNEGDNISMLNAEFLMVTADSFGKVFLRDLTFEDPYIIITILDCSTKKVGIVRLDIYDKNQKVSFVSWSGLKKLWEAERKKIVDDLNLLEFDY